MTSISNSPSNLKLWGNSVITKIVIMLLTVHCKVETGLFKTSVAHAKHTFLPLIKILMYLFEGKTTDASD